MASVFWSHRPCAQVSPDPWRVPSAHSWPLPQLSPGKALDPGGREVNDTLRCLSSRSSADATTCTALPGAGSRPPCGLFIGILSLHPGWDNKNHLWTLQSHPQLRPRTQRHDFRAAEPLKQTSPEMEDENTHLATGST
ncbi:hypothetical protein P7K49_000046 [Saguinus oedipus]|uniref:Uncharacterized protein n=1 Tax=Saguinus oedipus TaxID=9490 RepID=A0ABQ9WB01_SAGOE|nr:hypothetical protein P7K49_000046 [Saguinus oedipus]